MLTDVKGVSEQRARGVITLITLWCAKFAFTFWNFYQRVKKIFKERSHLGSNSRSDQYTSACHDMCSYETAPDDKVFLQYHNSNGTVSAFCLLKKGTYSTPTHKLRCDVYEYTFMSIHLCSGIASHLSGRVYIFNETILAEEIELGYISDISAANTPALCPYIYSSRALSEPECSYSLSESIQDRVLIPVCQTSSPSIHCLLCIQPLESQQCSLQNVFGIKLEEQVFLPSQNYSTISVPFFDLKLTLQLSNPTDAFNSELDRVQVVQGQVIDASKRELSNRLNLRAPGAFADILAPNYYCNSKPTTVAKASTSTNKAKSGGVIRRAGYDQLHFTKKKRGNSINFKKGLMVTNMKCPVQESTSHYSTLRTSSVFRGENNLRASSSSDSEGDSSASADSDSEEVRRKPQQFTSVPLASEESQKSTEPHHGQISSFGGGTDGENADLQNADDANLSVTSAVGIVQRRIQPQASNLKSVLQPTEETCDSLYSANIPVGGACGFQWLQTPKASHHAVQEESCSTPPVPTSYPCGLNQRDSDGSSSSDNYLGNFNELIEADYGIPRLDCVDDFKDESEVGVEESATYPQSDSDEILPNGSDMEELDFQEPIQEIQFNGAEHLLVTMHSLPPGLHLLYVNADIFGGQPPQSQQIEASNAGNDSNDHMHTALVEPSNDELVKSDPEP